MDKLGNRLDLASGCNLFQDAHPHHDFTTHGPRYLVIIGIFVLTQVSEEIILGILIFPAVGNLAGDILAHLVGQLCKHLLFLPAEKAAAP